MRVHETYGLGTLRAPLPLRHPLARVSTKYLRQSTHHPHQRAIHFQHILLEGLRSPRRPGLSSLRMNSRQHSWTANQSLDLELYKPIARGKYVVRVKSRASALSGAHHVCRKRQQLDVLLGRCRARSARLWPVFVLRRCKKSHAGERLLGCCI